MINKYNIPYNNKLSIIDNCLQALRKAKKINSLYHIEMVNQKGILLANIFNNDIERVSSACYLHSINIIIPQEEYIELCNAYNIEILDIEKKLPILLQPKISRLIANKIFMVEDSEVLDAISNHTTLNANPTEMDMIVFLSAKLCWDQEGIPPYNGIVAKELNRSLKHACLAYINFCLENDYFLAVHPNILAAKKYLEDNI